MKWLPRLLCLALGLVPLAASADPMRTRLQGAVDVVRQREGMQGVTAAVFTPNGDWILASGESHPGVPMRADHLLAVGSNTKTLTALVLLRLQERGLIDLDDRIGRYLPPLTNVDTTVTVRQLLNHTSGLGDYVSTQAYRDTTLAQATRLWTPPQLAALIPPPQFAPGTSWSYCGTNFLLAGMIAQQAGGAPMHTLLRNEIRVPLGLDSMRFVPQEALLGTLAHRWLGGSDVTARPMTAEWSGAWAAGAVVSTAGEMAELYEGLFSGALLSSASMSEFLNFIGPESYGLGITLKNIAGRDVIGHSGSIRGYTSTAHWVPSLSSVIVVLVNELPSTPIAVTDTLVRELAQATLDAPPVTPETTVRMLRRVSPNPATGSVRVAFTLPAASDVELAVFGADGRRVRTVARGRWDAGAHERVWDGRDDGGREVPPGLYLVRCSTPTLSDTRRVVRVR